MFLAVQGLASLEKCVKLCQYTYESFEPIISINKTFLFDVCIFEQNFCLVFYTESEDIVYVHYFIKTLHIRTTSNTAINIFL